MATITVEQMLRATSDATGAEDWLGFVPLGEAWAEGMPRALVSEGLLVPQSALTTPGQYEVVLGTPEVSAHSAPITVDTQQQTTTAMRVGGVTTTI